MKELVDIDESLLKLASESTGQTEKSALINMGLRALICPKKDPATLSTAPDAHTPRTPGGWEGLWIADDFDETPEEFLKYISDNND